MIRQGVKRFYRLLIGFFSIPILDYFRFYDRNSNNVIWIMGLNIRYFFTTSILWDLATISAIIKSRKSYSICINFDIKKLKSKHIFYTIHSKYNVFGFDNYVSIFDYLITEILQNDNVLFPSLAQTKFWENKAYMHRKFEELNIPTPKTFIFNKHNVDYKLLENFYPCIIKLIHSYESKGIFKINNFEELKKFVDTFDLSNQDFLVQEILNMRRDLRVIFVNNKIEHFYWRVNNSKEWRPTATSNGNSVDFTSFPEMHRKIIEDYSFKLGLSIGAFDIAWQNDDLNNTPNVLEVSPVFSPNPKTDDNYFLQNYGKFKKLISLKGYDYLYVKEIFRLKSIHISKLFSIEM